MPDFDLHAWFSDKELRDCPACGERATLQVTATESFFCFACGLLYAREGERTVDQVQEHEGAGPEVG
jgi:hypothetical protein